MITANPGGRAIMDGDHSEKKRSELPSYKRTPNGWWLTWWESRWHCAGRPARS